MEFKSCFDIIGPIMVGPSSSHTAGVVLIGRFIHELLEGTPKKATITFYDSFSETYQGHGTDKALLGGLLGYNTDDARIKEAIVLAKGSNLHYELRLEQNCPYYDHPNTTIVRASRGNRTIKVGGASIGGGLAKIFLLNEIKVDIRLNTGSEISHFVRDHQLLLGAREGDSRS